tara:strand:+ start:1313 stop:2026 length:714 start_codon:yes stop_codon:yes gene_type:complete
MPKAKLYVPGQNETLKLSRSQVSAFRECPRCFFMKKRHNVGTPGSPPFLLNSAVDGLLKTEFEIYRVNQKPHPLFEENNLNFVPMNFENEKWRNIKFEDTNHNMILSGILDDLWENKDTGEVVLADYKATSTQKNINIFITYKWQMDFYYWLLKKVGMNVSKECYFVYANADRYKDRFDATMHFKMSLKKYEADDSWVDSTLVKIRKTLDSDKIPESYEECKNCNYVKEINGVDISI